jgi:hypothetical protein
LSAYTCIKIIKKIKEIANIKFRIVG